MVSNGGSGWNEFDLLDIPVQVGTLYTFYQPEGQNFNYDNYNFGELQTMANQGEDSEIAETSAPIFSSGFLLPGGVELPPPPGIPTPQPQSQPPKKQGLLGRLRTYVSNEFNQGGCYNAFVQGAMNANFLSPLGGRYGDIQTAGVTTAQVIAVQSAGSSSIFSGVSAFAAEAAPYALPVYGLYLGTEGVIAEAEAKLSGTCN